jgi:glucosamine--fructose-6-phosphate aminotransferase (isomerizing)
VDSRGFRADLEEIPATLRTASDAHGSGHRWPLAEPPRRLLLLGMGSSFFAADVVARRLRTQGVDVVAELASAATGWPPSPDTTVVGISASGHSQETLDAIDRHAGRSRVIALTNRAQSAITERASLTIEMSAGDEIGGVACRSFRATLASLLGLEQRWFGGRLRDVLLAAADATEALLESEADWLPGVVDAAAGPDGTWLLAPAERLSSALQGALMLREGPRRRSDGCETGDWSHVDVYLTKTHDYRSIVFAGSGYDAAASRWMLERGSTSVAVSGDFPGAALSIRYPGDHDPLVALLTEVIVAELLAAHLWANEHD